MSAWTGLIYRPGENNSTVEPFGPKQMTLTCVCIYGINRGNKITVFKKRKREIGYVCMGLNGRMIVIEVDVKEGFFCIMISY